MKQYLTEIVRLYGRDARLPSCITAGDMLDLMERLDRLEHPVNTILMNQVREIAESRPE